MTKTKTGKGDTSKANQRGERGPVKVGDLVVLHLNLNGIARCITATVAEVLDPKTGRISCRSDHPGAPSLLRDLRPAKPHKWAGSQDGVIGKIGWEFPPEPIPEPESEPDADEKAAKAAAKAEKADAAKAAKEKADEETKAAADKKASDEAAKGAASKETAEGEETPAGDAQAGEKTAKS